MAERKRIDGNEKAAGYGRFYWIVDLVDGGWVSVHADRAEVNGGAVVFYGTNYPRTTAGDVNYDEPKHPEYPVIAFGAGQWRTFHAASLIDGSPVAVDRWVENAPEK